MRRPVLVALSVVVALASALPARAEGLGDRLEIAPFVGAWLPIASGRDEFKDAVLSGIQVVYDLHPNLALVGAFSWAGSGAQRLAGADVDMFQFDLGARLQQPIELDTALTLRPFVGLGAGLRTMHFRDSQYTGGDDFVGYASSGVEVGYRAFVLGLTGRYEFSNVPARSIGVRNTWSDVQLLTSAGLRF